MLFANIACSFTHTFLFQLLFLSSTEDAGKMFTEELSFLEDCLATNPKSYGSWQHRCFVMLSTPTPDWERELSLCSKFLKYDERNCTLYHNYNYNIKYYFPINLTFCSSWLQFIAGIIEDLLSNMLM